MSKAMMPNAGKGAEIRAYLERELGLPPNLKWFDVRFAVGETVTVRCEFSPQPVEVKEDQSS